MKFDEVIEERCSVREFKKIKKASWKDILEAIDAADKGPFAGNLNHLRYIIIENPRTIKELAKAAHQLWMGQANIVVAVCSDDNHLANTYGERGRIYGKQQAGAAISTLMLKLVDLGLSSCWVGAYNDKLVKTVLDVPEQVEVEALIPIGYAKQKEEKKRKQPLETSVYWESWRKGRRPSLFEESTKEIEFV